MPAFTAALSVVFNAKKAKPIRLIVFV